MLKFRAFSIGIVAAMLTACGGSQPPIGAPRAMPQKFANAYATVAAYGDAALPKLLVLQRYARSWVSPDAKAAKSLLFESDVGYDSVEMFALPDLNLRGVLTGFGYPQGLCSDAGGNVWVADTGGIAMDEFSHTGKLLQHFTVRLGYPVACAVNPVNGDLAVSNIQGTSDVGMVLIYTHPPGYSNVLSCAPLYSYYFVGYDPHGNLFLDGRDTSNDFHLCRGKDTEAKMSPMSITSGTIYFPGMVQWYAPGNYLAVGDQDCGRQKYSCVYHVAVSRKKGTIVGGTTPFNYSGGPVCDLVQGIISPGRQPAVLGGDYVNGCSGLKPNVAIWPYPGGALPLNYYDNGNFVDEPIGAAISTKP